MTISSKILFILYFHIIFLQQGQCVPTSCITCINCLDTYDGSDTNSTCSSTVSNADSCQKVRIQLPGTTLVAKACSRSCQEKSIVAGPIRFDVACCSTTNCNQARTLTAQPIVVLIILTIFHWLVTFI